MMLNLERIECSSCEGVFATGEQVIEEDNESYCESCYELRKKRQQESLKEALNSRCIVCGQPNDLILRDACSKECHEVWING